MKKIVFLICLKILLNDVENINVINVIIDNIIRFFKIVNVLI